MAAQYPDTTFAIVDSSVAEVGADNLTGLLFAEEQGSFLAGVAAALKTDDRPHRLRRRRRDPADPEVRGRLRRRCRRRSSPDITIDSQYIYAGR